MTPYGILPKPEIKMFMSFTDRYYIFWKYPTED